MKSDVIIMEVDCTDKGKVIVKVPFSLDVPEPYTFKVLNEEVVENFTKDGIELKKGDIVAFSEDEGFIYIKQEDIEDEN